MFVSPVPSGSRTLTPTLLVDDPDAVVSFLCTIFSAEQVRRTSASDGSARHVVLRLGDSLLEVEAAGAWGPRSAALHVYIEDADAVHARAVAAGARSLYPVTEMPYGDREAGVEDPWGNLWFLATHVEDVSPEEMKRRWERFNSPAPAQEIAPSGD